MMIYLRILLEIIIYYNTYKYINNYISFSLKHGEKLICRFQFLYSLSYKKMKMYYFT